MSDDVRPDAQQAELDDQDDERIDLDEIDPESWRESIPWWPGFGLILAVLALPVVSIVLSNIVAERLAAEAPDELGGIDLWRQLIYASLIAGAVLILIVPIAARLVRGRTNGILRLLEIGFPFGVVLVAIVVLLHSALAFAIVLGRRAARSWSGASRHSRRPRPCRPSQRRLPARRGRIQAAAVDRRRGRDPSGSSPSTRPLRRGR